MMGPSHGTFQPLLGGVGGGVAAATVAKYLGALDYKAPAPPSMAPAPFLQ